MFSKSYEDQLNAAPMMKLDLNLEESGFAANTEAAYNQFIREDLSISRMAARQPYVDANIEAYTAATGEAPPAYAIQYKDFDAEDIELFKAADRGDRQALEAFRAERRQQPIYPHVGYKEPEQLASPQHDGKASAWQSSADTLGNKYAAWQWWQQQAGNINTIKSFEHITTQVSNDLAIKRKEANEIFYRANGWGNVGQFVGTMGGAMTDPINLATLGFSSPYTLGAGATVGLRLAAASAEGFAINAATETLIQPQVYDFKQEIGANYSIGDAINNIIAAGAGGALLSAAGKGGSIALDKYGTEVVKGLKRINRKIALQGTVESRAARKAIVELVEVLEDSPIKNIDTSITGIKTHLGAYNKAQTDFRDGHWPDTRDITRYIDEPEAMGAVRLEQIKQELGKDVSPLLTPDESKMLSGDLQRLDGEIKTRQQQTAELKAKGSQALSLSDIVKDIKRTNPKLPARKAKQQAQAVKADRESILSGEPDAQAVTLTKQKAEAQSKLDKNAQSTKASDLLAKVEDMQQRGMPTESIINEVAKVRPDIAAKMPKIKPQAPTPRPKAERPAQPQRQLETPVETQARRAKGEKPPEQQAAVTKGDKTAEQKISKEYYSGLDEMDAYFNSVYRDVDSMLKKDDVAILTGDGEISARNYIAQADNELKAAEAVRGCLLK